MRDWKIIKLSEVSQTKKNKYHMILLTCEILKNDTSNLFTKQKLRLKKQTWLPREKVGGKE